VVKILIAAGASVALVTAAAAADLPHPQPVYQPAPPVGKGPIGKGPVGYGKGPVGVGKGPYGPPVRY
jgi:opacity protein-like surface antigen